MPGLYNLTPFTLLDYPGEMACIVWMAGCNMRCVYCHNPDIVTGKGAGDPEKLLGFLKGRTGRLGAVVFSGGEATLDPGLPDLIRQVKALGFKVKLDTNGSRPEVVRALLAEGLLDYVAMDYKAPPEKLEAIAGTAKWGAPFRESLAMLIAAAGDGQGCSVMPAKAGDSFDSDSLLKKAKKTKGTPACAGVTGEVESTLSTKTTVMPAKAGIPFGSDEEGASLCSAVVAGKKTPFQFEVRTTIHPDLLTVEDVAWMIRDLEAAGYKGTYYLQLIQATGEKTIGHVAPPETVFDRSRLPVPAGFELGFRNFKND